MTPDLIANFQSPNVSKERVQAAAANLFAVFQKRLRGTGAVVPIEVECPLDVFRSCFGEKGTPACIRGYRSYQREDFTSLELPRGWEYFVKQDGNGQCLAFPVLMKEVLTFTQPNYELSEDGTIVKIEEVLPIERVLVRACLNGYQLS